MTDQPRVNPASTPSATEIAAAAHASDLFVFRRIAEGRYAHVGGVGRGAGWAGIVEVGADEEPLLAAALAPGNLVRRFQPEPWHVVGPYYGRAVALVAVTDDVFVLFGAPENTIAAVADDDLRELARVASEALVDVAPAKRLADELEALNAVRDLLREPAQTYGEALQRLVDHATVSLSCDLGLLYVREGKHLVVSDRRRDAGLNGIDVSSALAAIAEWGTFPVCVQRATSEELPPPFSSADGVLAYYLLELRQPLSGVLLLLHTTADAPRGFTLLCQSLGARLVEAAEPLLAAALHRDTMNAELARAAAEARRDPLTGLANRLAWNEALATAAPCSDSPTSIVQLDCRDLKVFNETHGHHVGDQVLCRVAAALKASVRTGDLVARLGGDEFAILLRGADEGIVRTVVGRVESTLAGDRASGQPEIRLSIGSATSRGEDLQAVQQRADAAMLDAKRAGRGSSQRRSA